MKPKRSNCTRNEASKKASSLGMKLKSGGFPGSIVTWSNGRQEIVFCPDHAYTSDGCMEIREVRKESQGETL